MQWHQRVVVGVVLALVVSPALPALYSGSPEPVWSAVRSAGPAAMLRYLFEPVVLPSYLFLVGPAIASRLARWYVASTPGAFAMGVATLLGLVVGGALIAVLCPCEPGVRVSLLSVSLVIAGIIATFVVRRNPPPAPTI